MRRALSRRSFDGAIFGERWPHLKARQLPGDFSPCGITLDEMRPILSRHPERYYDWIAEANIVVPEVLLVPLYRGSNEPLGTLWIVSDQIGQISMQATRAQSANLRRS